MVNATEKATRSVLSGVGILAMLRRLNYLWRLIGTGFSFFVFGAISILFWGILFPVIELFLGTGIPKKRRTRRIMQHLFSLYMRLMRAIGILNFEIHGREYLNAPGKLVIANHPSLLDIVFLLSQISNATCIVKPALFANPFMRIPIRAIGYIYAESPEDLLALCTQELHEGSTLVIFPEGTRTTPGMPIKFQRGAASIALAAQTSILPITLGCHPSTLTKQKKWYQIPDKKFTLSLAVGEEIQVELVNEDSKRSLMTRHITRQLESYFIEQMTLNQQS